MAHSRALARVLVVAAALLASGCSTTTISMQSTPPQTEVFVGKLGEKAHSVGQTPLTFPAGEFVKTHDLVGPVLVEFRKEGYTPTRIIVTDFTVGNVTINADMPATTGLEDQDKLNTVMDTLFEGQRLGRVGRFEEAIVKIKEVQRVAPQLAASYEIEGGILYLQKKYKDAYDAFGLALKRNPKNYPAAKVRAALQKQLGIDPAKILPPVEKKP